MNKKRILFICSLPRGKHEVRFTDEIGVIEERLLLGSERDQFDFVPKMAVKPTYLMKTVVGSVNQEAPYILHFSLHGNKKLGLIFSGEKQDAAYQPPIYFETLFESISDAAWHIKGIIFSACHSLPFARIVRPYVDFAIGIEDTIPDEAAIEFAAGFYTTLFDGWPIKKCFAIGRTHVKQWVQVNGIETPEGEAPYPERIFLI